MDGYDINGMLEEVIWKYNVAVDMKKNKKIISLEVTSEVVHDGRMLNKLVDNASENNHVQDTISTNGVPQATNYFSHFQIQLTWQKPSQTIWLNGPMGEPWLLRGSF